MNQLGVVTDIVETAGMGVSYAYEDLVFLDHNSFLLQFTDNDREVLVHSNSEADQVAVSRDIGKLQEIARSRDMQFVKGTEYTLSQADGESVTVEFSKAAVDH